MVWFGSETKPNQLLPALHGSEDWSRDRLYSSIYTIGKMVLLQSTNIAKLLFGVQQHVVLKYRVVCGASRVAKLKKTVDPLVRFLKSTEVGGKEGSREYGLEWERKDDQMW